MAQCKDCIHCAVCERLEEFRDPLGWINTEDEFVCSYYREDADVVPKSDVEKIFEEIESKLMLNKAIHCGQKFYYTRLEDDIAELKKKYTESEGKK